MSVHSPLNTRAEAAPAKAKRGVKSGALILNVYSAKETNAIV